MRDRAEALEVEPHPASTDPDASPESELSARRHRWRVVAGSMAMLAGAAAFVAMTPGAPVDGSAPSLLDELARCQAGAALLVYEGGSVDCV